MRVLLVGGRAGERHLLARLLRAQDHSVATAPDAIRALRFLRIFRPRLDVLVCYAGPRDLIPLVSLAASLLILEPELRLLVLAPQRARGVEAQQLSASLRELDCPVAVLRRPFTLDAVALELRALFADPSPGAAAAVGAG